MVDLEEGDGVAGDVGFPVFGHGGQLVHVLHHGSNDVFLHSDLEMTGKHVEGRDGHEPSSAGGFVVGSGEVQEMLPAFLNECWSSWVVIVVIECRKIIQIELTWILR